jgi:hypothetical protein
MIVAFVYAVRTHVEWLIWSFMLWKPKLGFQRLELAQDRSTHLTFLHDILVRTLFIKLSKGTLMHLYASYCTLTHFIGLYPFLTLSEAD